MITHYVDLNVYTHKIHKEMRFLVADIGKEDVLLGYPWCQDQPLHEPETA